MATTTELLRLIIDADAKGALAGMEAVGASAEKNLGKTDERMRRIGAGMVTFGAGLATAGAVAGAGLFKLAQMSEDAESQSRKLANSIANSDQVFRSNGAALRDQAQALQQMTAADGDAVVGAQSLLVQFGETEAQVQTLTPLMVDLSRKMGVDLDVAAKAIGKSVDGSAVALKKMGIVVDEAKFAIDPFAATVDALRGTVGGFAEQEGKTFNGQLEILKNNLGDLGESVGGGAAGVLSGITDKLGDMAHYLGETNPEMGEMVGRLGTLGAIGAVGVGSLSFVTGQFIQMRQNLGPLMGHLRNAEGGLTGLGKAAGIAGGAIGTLVAADALFSWLNSSAGHAEKAKLALDELTIAIGTNNQEDAFQAFADATAAEQNTLRVQNLWQEFGAEIDLVGTGVKADVEQAQRTLDSMDPTQVRGALDALQAATEELDPNSRQYAINTEFIDRNREALEISAQAQAVSAEVTGDTAAAYEGLGVTIGDATSAYEAYNSAVLGSLNSMVGLFDAAENLTDAQGKVAAAQAKVTALEAAGQQGTEDYAQAVTGLRDANWDAAKSAIKQQEAVQKLKADVDAGKISTDAATAAVADLAASGAITATQADMLSFAIAGASSKADELGRKNPRPTVTLDDAGFWNPWFKVATAPEPEKTAHVTGNTESFWTAMHELNRYAIPDKWVTVRANWSDALKWAGGARAAGGPVSSGRTYLVGERGPELFRAPSSGTIVPNHRLQSGGGAPRQQTVTITVNALSSQGVESAVLDALARANRAGLSAVPGVR